MADITTGCTFVDQIPNLGRKMMYVETAATADADDTVDVGDYMDSIDMVLCFNQTDQALETVAYTGTVITMATGTDEIRAMLVIGA